MLQIDWAHLLENFPPQLATFLIAMLPIAELRGSIPVAMGAFKMSWWQAYIFSILGNILPLIFILKWLEPVSQYLSKRSKICDRFFKWLFDRTRRKHSQRFARWGSFALVTFVAIPLPITGGWTGSVAAFVFGIPFKKSLPLVTLGVLIAGVIVTLASLGVISIF